MHLFPSFVSLLALVLATHAASINPVSNTTLAAGQVVEYSWTGEAPFNLTIRNRFPMFNADGSNAGYLGRSDVYVLTNTTNTTYSYRIPNPGWGSNWTMYAVLDDSSGGSSAYVESTALSVVNTTTTTSGALLTVPRSFQALSLLSIAGGLVSVVC